MDYGFGSGENLIHLHKKGFKIFGLETSSKAIELVEKKIRKKNLPKNSIRLVKLNENDKKVPFEDNFFDNIICTSVLSLLNTKENIIQLLNEFHRILKPGGKAILDINDSKVSDFSRDADYLGDDVYLYPSKPDPGDTQVKTLCLPDADSFVALIEPYFEIDDIGYSAHKLFESEIHEFIVCCHKTNNIS